MKAILLLIALISTLGFAQSISISPSNLIESVVSLTYYDSEYIYITNTSSQSIILEFEMIENTLPHDWAASGCNNMICYPSIPSDGTFGEMPAGFQAYMATNLATNEVTGSGLVRYAIYSKSNPEIRDTISFFYKVEEELNSEPQPWVKLNFAQNVVTLFLENESVKTTVKIFDLSGKLILENPVAAISSFSLLNLSNGIYIIAVENENGKRLVQKVSVIN